MMVPAMRPQAWSKLWPSAIILPRLAVITGMYAKAGPMMETMPLPKYMLVPAGACSVVKLGVTRSRPTARHMQEHTGSQQADNAVCTLRDISIHVVLANRGAFGSRGNQVACTLGTTGRPTWDAEADDGQDGSDAADDAGRGDEVRRRVCVASVEADDDGRRRVAGRIGQEVLQTLRRIRLLLRLGCKANRCDAGLSTSDSVAMLALFNICVTA